MSEKNSQLLLISCLIAAIALFHYGTPHNLLYMHILLQSLFFIPVSLAGLWFGKKGGLMAALAVTAVYLHHAMTVMMPTTDMAVDNSIQIFMLFVVGFLTGAYADIKHSYNETIYGSKSYPDATFPEEQSLLVYVDDSAAAMNAVRYVASLFSRIPDVRVTLLNVLSKANPDFFKTTEEHNKEQARSFKSNRTAVERAYQLLLAHGFNDKNVNIRFAHSQGARTSDVILHEQKSRGYSAIIIGRHELSRTEEFLFGSVAIRLARKATCPVWVIGESVAAEAPVGVSTMHPTANQTR